MTIEFIRPDKLSTNVIRMASGACRWRSKRADGTWDEGRVLYDNRIDIDLTKVGLNGRDRNDVSLNWTVTADGTPFKSGESIWCVENPTTGEVGYLSSAARFIPTLASTAETPIAPPGFVVRRKLPFGFMYNASRDGIPNFHLEHWPGLPRIRFTDAEYGSNNGWMPLFGAETGGAWADLDLSGYLPDAARLAYIICETRDAGIGLAGSAYIRSHGGQASGLLVGSSKPGSNPVQHPIDIRVDSLRKMEYRTTPGCKLYVTVLGYSMTEQS